MLIGLIVLNLISIVILYKDLARAALASEKLFSFMSLFVIKESMKFLAIFKIFTGISFGPNTFSGLKT